MGERACRRARSRSCLLRVYLGVLEGPNSRAGSFLPLDQVQGCTPEAVGISQFKV